MKKSKNIYLLGLLFISVLFFNNDVVFAAPSLTEFYTETECRYENNKGNLLIIKRKYTSDGVINTVITHDKDNRKKSEKAMNFNQGYSAAYVSTTTCPEKVYTLYNEIYGFGVNDGKDYGLKKVVKSGKNIYNKMPRCEYRTKTDTLDGDEYALIFQPKFSTVKTFDGVEIPIISYSIKMQRTAYRNGIFVWEDYSDVPPLQKGNASFEACPTFALYNYPDIWNHGYVLKNDMTPPSGWKGYHVMDRYVDLSDAYSKMDKILDNYIKLKDGINKEISSCFNVSGSLVINDLTCSSLKPKAGCLTYDKVNQNNQLLLRTYEDTLSALRNVQVDEMYKVSDIVDQKLEPSSLYLYSGIVDKHREIVKKVEEINNYVKQMISCLFEHLMNDQTLSDAERDAIIDAKESAEQQWSEAIEKIKKIQLDLGVDYGEYDCSYFLSPRLIDWLDKAYLVLEIGAGIAVIVLGMLDFSKAVTSGEDNAMKKAWQSFIKRVIALGCLILLPFLVEFILDLINIPGLTNKNPLCK